VVYLGFFVIFVGVGLSRFLFPPEFDPEKFCPSAFFLPGNLPHRGPLGGELLSNLDRRHILDALTFAVQLHPVFDL